MYSFDQSHTKLQDVPSIPRNVWHTITLPGLDFSAIEEISSTHSFDNTAVELNAKPRLELAYWKSGSDTVVGILPVTMAGAPVSYTDILRVGIKTGGSWSYVEIAGVSDRPAGFYKHHILYFTDSKNLVTDEFTSNELVTVHTNYPVVINHELFQPNNPNSDGVGSVTTKADASGHLEVSQLSARALNTRTHARGIPFLEIFQHSLSGSELEFLEFDPASYRGRTLSTGLLNSPAHRQVLVDKEVYLDTWVNGVLVPNEDLAQFLNSFGIPLSCGEGSKSIGVNKIYWNARNIKKLANQPAIGCYLWKDSNFIGPVGSREFTGPIIDRYVAFGGAVPSGYSAHLPKALVANGSGIRLKYDYNLSKSVVKPAKKLVKYLNLDGSELSFNGNPIHRDNLEPTSASQILDFDFRSNQVKLVWDFTDRYLTDITDAEISSCTYNDGTYDWVSISILGNSPDLLHKQNEVYFNGVAYPLRGELILDFPKGLTQTPYLGTNLVTRWLYRVDPAYKSPTDSRYLESFRDNYLNYNDGVPFDFVAKIENHIPPFVASATCKNVIASGESPEIKWNFYWDVAGSNLSQSDVTYLSNVVTASATWTGASIPLTGTRDVPLTATKSDAITLSSRLDRTHTNVFWYWNLSSTYALTTKVETPKIWRNGDPHGLEPIIIPINEQRSLELIVEGCSDLNLTAVLSDPSAGTITKIGSPNQYELNLTKKYIKPGELKVTFTSVQRPTLTQSFNIISYDKTEYLNLFMLTVTPEATKIKAGQTVKIWYDTKQDFGGTYLHTAGQDPKLGVKLGTSTYKYVEVSPKVSTTYVVTAFGAGTDTLTEVVTITVGATTDLELKLSDTVVNLLKGEGHQFIATVPPNGITQNVINWTSSAGTITPLGYYTAPDFEGTFTVTASLEGSADPNMTKTATVVVASKSITVFPDTASVQVKKTQKFDYLLKNIPANEVISWQTDLGTIDNTGLYTAPDSVPSGVSNIATIIAQTTTMNPAINDKALVNVVTATSPTIPKSVSIVPNANISLTSGATQQFSASVTGLGSQTVIWEASVGTISPSGLYTAPANYAGSAIIKATADADATVVAFVTISITSSGSKSVTVTPTVVQMAFGGLQQFYATTAGLATQRVTWSASNGSITQTGMLTAPASSGTITVTATSLDDSSVAGTATVTVSASVVTPGNYTFKTDLIPPIPGVRKPLFSRAAFDFSTGNYPKLPNSYPVAYEIVAGQVPYFVKAINQDPTVTFSPSSGNFVVPFTLVANITDDSGVITSASVVVEDYGTGSAGTSNSPIPLVKQANGSWTATIDPNLYIPGNCTVTVAATNDSGHTKSSSHDLVFGNPLLIATSSIQSVTRPSNTAVYNLSLSLTGVNGTDWALDHTQYATGTLTNISATGATLTDTVPASSTDITRYYDVVYSKPGYPSVKQRFVVTICAQAPVYNVSINPASIAAVQNTNINLAAALYKDGLYDTSGSQVQDMRISIIGTSPFTVASHSGWSTLTNSWVTLNNVASVPSGGQHLVEFTTNDDGVQHTSDVAPNAKFTIATLGTYTIKALSLSKNISSTVSATIMTSCSCNTENNCAPNNPCATDLPDCTSDYTCGTEGKTCAPHNNLCPAHVGCGPNAPGCVTNVTCVVEGSSCPSHTPVCSGENRCPSDVPSMCAPNCIVNTLGCPSHGPTCASDNSKCSADVCSSNCTPQGAGDLCPKNTTPPGCSSDPLPCPCNTQGCVPNCGCDGDAFGCPSNSCPSHNGPVTPTP